MLKAVRDTIIVKMIKQESKTPGGIVLTTNTVDIHTGEVVSIGKGVDEFDMKNPPCKKGDTILFGYYNENKSVRSGEDTLYFLDFGEILAIEN